MPDEPIWTPPSASGAGVAVLTGAPGNAGRISDGAMTSGSPILSTATPAAFAQGMSVYVSGAGQVAGSIGAALRAKVLSVNVGLGQVTLDTNAVTTCSGSQVDFGNSDIAPFQAAINAVSAAGGGDLVVPQSPNGAYLFDVDATSWPNHYTPGGYHAVNYAASVPSNVRLLFGEGVILRFPFNGGTGFDPTAAAFLATGASHVEIANATIDGCAVAGGNLEAEHYGLLISDGVDDCRITGNRFHHMYGKGFLVQGSTTPATRVTARGNHAHHNMGQLCTVAAGSRHELLNNTCRDNLSLGAEAIILTNCSHVLVDGLQESSQGTPVSLTVRNDHITITHVDGDNQIALNGAMSDIQVVDNLIDVSAQTALTGIALTGTASFAGLKIADNIILTNTSNAIQVQPSTASSDLLISDNLVIGAGGMQVGGGAGAISQAEVTDNILDGGGIVASAGVSTVTGNTIKGGSLSISASNAVVTGNSVSGPTTAGAYAVSISGGNNTLTGNVFVGNQPDNTSATLRTTGAGATANKVADNQIKAAGAGARTIWDGQSGALSNTFTGNTLTNGGGSQIGGTGAGSVLRSNDGYNPQGLVVVAVPATTVAVAAAVYDRTFYVTAGASTCTMAIQSGPSVVIPANALATIRVPAGLTVTPTYTSAPTWLVEGE